jgi:hypothetical protein
MTLDDSVALLPIRGFHGRQTDDIPSKLRVHPTNPVASQRYFTRREHVRLREFEDYAIRDRPARIDMLD